jgi:hypothetical protein
MPPASTASPHLPRLVLVVSALATATVYWLPTARALSYPFVLLSTLAHEMGHGLAALAIGGSFSSLELFTDGSGVATTATATALQNAFVAAGGLVGPSLTAVALFVMGKTPARARFCLGLTALLLVAALAFVVRNTFGWVFVTALAALCAMVAWKGRDWLTQLLLVFGATQLALSVYSRGDYLFTPIAHTGAGALPSDAAQISEGLFFPYWFWGGLCGAFSIAVLLFGLRYYWRLPSRA